MNLAREPKEYSGEHSKNHLHDLPGDPRYAGYYRRKRPSRMKVICRTLAIVALMFTALPAALIGAALIGKVLEQRYYPVLANFKFEIAEVRQNSLVIRVWGEKERNCRRISMSALVNLPDVHWMLANVRFLGNGVLPARPLIGHVHDAIRPTGPQYFGYWEVSPPGAEVRFVARHFCHGMWESVTELGILHIPDSDPATPDLRIPSRP